MPVGQRIIGTQIAVGEPPPALGPAERFEDLPAGARVTRRDDLDGVVLDELRAAAAGGEKVLRWFAADIIDEQGEVVARTRKQLYVRRKPGR